MVKIFLKKTYQLFVYYSSCENILHVKKIFPEKYNLKLDSYQEFHEWSCENYDLFWSEVWDFCGVISSKKAEFVIDKKVPMNEIPKWFTGAKMNYAENLLRYSN